MINNTDDKEEEEKKDSDQQPPFETRQNTIDQIPLKKNVVPFEQLLNLELK
jgi:hypothetical protein